MSPTACGAVLLGSPPRCLFSSSFLEKWQTNRPPATAIHHGKMVLLITLFLVKECVFFLSVSCVSAQRKPFLLPMDSPSLSPAQCVCSSSQMHPCLSLTSPHFHAVGAAGLEILTTLPKSPTKAMAVESRASQQEPRQSSAVSGLFTLCWDWSEHCLLPSATSTLPRSRTFRFKDDQTVFLWCLFCKHTHLHYASQMPLHFLPLFLHFPVPAYLFFMGFSPLSNFWFKMNSRTCPSSRELLRYVN